MDDKAFVGLVIAILAVFIYYQWIFVACLLAIVGTGAAVRRQIAVTDKQKFRKDLQTNIRGSDKCSSARNIQTLETSRLHANDDENCNVERNEGENDEKDDTKEAAIYSDTTNKAGIIIHERDRGNREEPRKDLQTNILITGADKSIDNIKTPETGRLDANVDKNCTVDTKEEHSDKKRDYQIEETFSDTTQRGDTNVAAIYSDTTNKAGIIFHEEDREDREAKDVLEGEASNNVSSTKIPNQTEIDGIVNSYTKEFVSEVKRHEDDKKPEATSIKEKEKDVRVLGSVCDRSTENTTTAQCISHETNERTKIKSTENIEKAFEVSTVETTNDIEVTELPKQVKIDKVNTESCTKALDMQKGQSANDKAGTKIALQEIDETNIISSTEILNITCASVENSLIESTSSDNRLQCTLEEYGLDNCHWSRILKDHLGVTTVQQLEYLDGEDTQKLKEHVRHNWEKKALDKLFIQDEFNVKYKSDATNRSTEETVSKRTSEDHFGQKKSEIDNYNSENVSVHISEEQTLAVVNKLGLRGFFPNGLTLQRIIRIQKLSNHDRFDDIPWVFMRNIMMINWTARDILIERHLERLWESQQMSTEDWNFESTNKDTDVPKNTPQTVNPLDLIVALWHCCSPILLQVLSTKMFMCRLAIPFSLPPREDSLPVLSAWGIRQIIIEQKTSGGTLQTSAYKCPCHVVSFIRLGKICLSKSKLINQLLSEQYHDTFFNRDCPLGTTKRLISDGLLEAAWHLPRENSENVMLYLNLRGDGLLQDKQIHVISQISSVVVILMDISLLSQTSSTEILHKMYESTTGVVLGIDACSRSESEAREICHRHFTDNSNYRNKIRVCKLAVDDTISSFSLIKKEMMKGVTDIASCDTIISLSKRLNKINKECYHIDEDSRMFQQAIKKAVEITQLLQDDSSNLKDRHVPLQGKLWRQFSETQKATKQSTLHQPITDEENKKEQMMRQRKEQLKIVKQQRTLMKRFQSNLLDNKSEEGCILFITYLRLFLDDVSRNSLPAYLNQYQIAWQELKTERDNKEKKMEVLQERLKQAEYNLANASFGYEHLVRECGQIYECIIECDEKNLITKAKDLSKICAQIILLGQPFEIMDGDAANVPMKWIRAVFTQLRKLTGNRKILALSVLGIQSSGKSTLLNTMFGLQFAVSAGRCTRGVYVQLVPVNSKQFKFDYILVVDTEGLRASELGNQKRDHDNKLATFVIGLGDITIINIKGENTAEITDILQIAVHAFLRLKLVNQKLNLKQKCIFVHQNVPATDASDKMLHGRKKLVESLDEMTKEAAKQEQITNVQTFDQVIDFDSEKNVWYFSDLWVGDPPMAPTNPGYSKSVADVKHAILYELTPKRDTFFTIKDTLIRMEDLWTGILRDDFVYGFRNSLEMKAYSTMEKRYQEVHWNLHKFFYEFVINKAKTVIESSSEEDDLETRSVQIRKELQQESESIVNILLEELESFVNTSDLKDVMSQWTPTRALRLKILKEDLLSTTETDIMNIREEKRIHILQMTERTKHEVEINERAIQLAKTLKGKKADKRMMEEKFEIMWSDWLKNFSPTLLDVHDERSVQDKIDKLVWDRFPSISSYMKTQQKAYLYETLTCLVGSLTPKDFEIGTHLEIHKRLSLGTISNALGITQENLIKYKIQATDIGNTIFRRIDVTLRDTASQDARFNVKSVADILRIIENAIDDHNTKKSQHLQFNLLPPYKALLIQHVVRYITIFFANQEEEYTRRHSLRGQLEEYRETAWQLFKNVVDKKTEDHITAGFFKQALTKAVIDHVLDLIPIDIQDMMMLKFSHQKYSVIRDVMIYLADKNDFDECYRYIVDPSTFVQEWLTKQMHTLVFDQTIGKSNQYTLFAEKRIRKIFQGIEKAVKSITIEKADKSVTHTRSLLYYRHLHASPIKKWISSFTANLTKEPMLPIYDFCFSHVTANSEIDVSSFTQIVLDQLEDMEETVCKHFTKTSVINIKWKKSPMSKLMDQLWGCTATCPFCYEPCTNTDKDHTELGVDHQCLQHRIKGLSGTKWKGSDNLTLHFCNVDVQGNAISFLKRDGDNEKWVKFNAYKTEYPKWYIEPSPDNSKYWIWLLCKYQNEFEEKHKGKFDPIPKSWKKMAKKEATNSLKH